MFSNSTEGEMFTGARCSRCIHAYQGYDFCDDAAVILFGEPPPEFLIRVPVSEANPVGVECTRFAPEQTAGPHPVGSEALRAARRDNDGADIQGSGSA